MTLDENLRERTIDASADALFTVLSSERHVELDGWDSSAARLHKPDPAGRRRVHDERRATTWW